MNFIRESLETPVMGEYDVIVAGAGPAGCGAAIAAARAGAKTLLIDRANCPGGMWGTGFMNPLFDHKNKGGILAELIAELDAAGQWGGFWGISFHYEYMKHLLDRKLSEAGAEVILNTTVTRTLCDGNTVTGVITENIDGRCAYLSKILIDCTGDGSAAASAGCAYEIGGEAGIADLQAMTLMFLVGNIPPQYRDGLMIGPLLEEAYAAAGKEIPFRRPFLIPVPDSTFGVVQFTHMYGYDPLSAASLSAAAAEGRRQMIEAFALLRTHNEEFRSLELIASAPALGVRESRRIVGEYVITLDDLTEGRKFDDAVADVTFNIDIHNRDGRSQDCRRVKPYQIPLRALIPRGYEGILVAGRCISGTHEAMASYRVTGNCCQMGERAGMVAVYAARHGISPRNVCVRDVITQ